MTVRNWGGATGAWSDPTQWVSGLPLPADDASFLAGVYTVLFATQASLADIFGGSATSTLDIASGPLTLTGNSGLSGFWNGPVIQTGGTFAIASGAFNANGDYAQGGGAIALGLGASLALQVTATLGGAVTGLGTLRVGGTVTLASARVQVGAISIASTGSLILTSDETFGGSLIANFGSMVLGGHNLTVTGAGTLGDQIVGPGTLTVTGTSDFAGALAQGSGLNLVVTGFATDDRGLAFSTSAGQSGTLTVAAGGVFDFVADVAISGGTNDLVVVAGLLEKTAGIAGQRSIIQAPLTSIGTVRSQVGNLLLAGPGTVLGGTLDGAGTISIGGSATLAPGATVSVANLDVGYGATLALAASFLPTGNINLTSSNATLALQGNALTVQGPGPDSLGGTISAQGSATTTGSLIVRGVYDFGNMVVTGGTLFLEDAGAVFQSNNLVLGLGSLDHVAFQIDAGAQYIITRNDSGRIYTYNSGTTLDAAILNNGNFIDTAGDGTGSFHVDTAFANNTTGTLDIEHANFLFGQSFINDGTGTLGGIVSFAGGLVASTGHFGTLEILSGSTITITGTVNATSTLDFVPGAGTGATLVLNSPTLFHGTVGHFATGETIDLKNVRVNTYSRSANIVSFNEVLNGVTTFPVNFLLSNPPGSFVLESDGNGGTDIIGGTPSGAFSNLNVSAAAVSWNVPETSGFWDNPLNWSNGATPVAQNDVTVANLGTLVYRQDPVGTSTGTVNSLSGNAVLLLNSGDLFVDAGGAWGGAVTVSGGEFISVTGYTFAGPTFNLVTNARLRSDGNTLAVNSPSVSVTGTLFGSGTISFGGTATIDQSASITVGQLRIGAAGRAVFNGSQSLVNGFELDGTMLLTGGTLTLGGSSILAGNLANPGEVDITGAADLSNFTFVANDRIFVAGTAFEAANGVSSSGNGGISVNAGATYDIRDDVNLVLNTGTGQVFNSGLFEKSGGSGLSNVYAYVTSTGTVAVQSGTLNFVAGGLDLGGTLSGQGSLTIGLNGSAPVLTLEPGALLTVAALTVGSSVIKGDESYNGTFTSAGTLNLQGHTLSLGFHDALSGSLAGGGMLVTTNSADLNSLTVTGAGTVLRDFHFMTQSGGVSLGGTATDSVTLEIDPSATYYDLADTFIIGTLNGVVLGTISNAGLFAKTGGNAATVVSAALVNTGSVLVAHATLTLSAAVLNDSVITVNGVLTESGGIDADLGAAGSIVLGPAGTLVATGAIGASQSITYDPGGLIQIGAAPFAGTIVGFQPGDRLEFLNNVAISGAGYVGGNIVLAGGGTISAPGLTNPAGLTLSNDGINTYLSEIACFAEGTCILTDTGYVAVEALSLGMRAVVRSGAAVPIVWIGRRHVDCRRHPNPEAVRPVRVRADAFGPGTPRRDVRLSPDHAVLVDDVLIPVQLLVNGNSIVPEDVAAVRYFHVELPSHDVLLADGLPCESYLDTGNRGAFANADPVAGLRPARADLPRVRGIANLAVTGAALERVRAALGVHEAGHPTGSVGKSCRARPKRVTALS